MLKATPKLRSLVAVTALVGLATALGSCDDEAGPKAANGSSAVKPEAPAPPGLLAELVLTGPQELLVDLREAAGGPTLFLPRTVGGLLVNVFGLPLQATEAFDEHLPVVGAVGAVPDSPLAAPDWCVAVHVRDPAALLTVLTGGRDARFVSTREGDHVWLEAKPNGPRQARLDVAVGLLDSYFLAGPSREALERLGPYVARTLSRRSVATQRGVAIELREGAIGPDLRRRFDLLRLWLGKLSLPAPWSAVLDVDGTSRSFGAMVEGVRTGHVQVKLDDGALELDAVLTMAAAPPALRRGAPAELLTLPDDTLAALMWSESAASRSAGAEQQATTLGSLLGDLPGDSLARILGSLARGRGDRTTVAVRCTGVGITGMAAGDVADPAELDRGLKEMATLREHAAVKDALKRRGVELSAKKTRIVQVPEDVWRWRLTPTTLPETETRLGVIDLLTSWGEQRFLVAAGLETIDTLQLLHAPDPGRSWSQKETIRSAVGRLPPEVWLAAVVDPQATHACLLGKPGGSFAAPFSLAVGPGPEGRVVVRLAVARPLLRFVAKELGGF